jgi:hypothetical protein
VPAAKGSKSGFHLQLSAFRNHNRTMYLQNLLPELGKAGG